MFSLSTKSCYTIGVQLKTEPTINSTGNREPKMCVSYEDVSLLQELRKELEELAALIATRLDAIALRFGTELEIRQHEESCACHQDQSQRKSPSD